MTDDLQVMFRPRNQTIEGKFREAKEKFQELTNKQKYGDNATVNFLVTLGYERMKNLEIEGRNAEKELKKAAEL